MKTWLFYNNLRVAKIAGVDIERLGIAGLENCRTGHWLTLEYSTQRFCADYFSLSRQTICAYLLPLLRNGSKRCRTRWNNAI